MLGHYSPLVKKVADYKFFFLHPQRIPLDSQVAAGKGKEKRHLGARQMACALQRLRPILVRRESAPAARQNSPSAIKSRFFGRPACVPRPSVCPGRLGALPAAT